MYDYLIVGSGLYGAVCAYELARAGKSGLVIDRRDHIGGNVYTESVEGINVHRYGAHIFHTSDRRVWEYVNRFAEFNAFGQSAHCALSGRMLQSSLQYEQRLPSSGATCLRPRRRKRALPRSAARRGFSEPKNLEEQALSLVGRTIYEKLIKGYTEKQWGRPCTELPAFIIRRLPVRFLLTTIISTTAGRGSPVGGYNQDRGKAACRRGRTPEERFSGGQGGVPFHGAPRYLYGTHRRLLPLPFRRARIPFRAL